MEGSVSVLWWEEVRLCRCSIFFFFLSSGTMKGDKDGKAKGKGQDPRRPKPNGAVMDGGMTPSLTTTCRYETTARAAETIQE